MHFFFQYLFVYQRVTSIIEASLLPLNVFQMNIREGEIQRLNAKIRQLHGDISDLQAQLEVKEAKVRVTDESSYILIISKNQILSFRALKWHCK